MTFRHLPPAGAPIRLSDLRGWVVALRESVDPKEELAGVIRARFGVAHCGFSSTGRAGLAIILRALRALASPDRNEVLVPAYTCYSVPASVVLAGLKPRIVDIDPETLDFNPERLDAACSDRVLAIVATNLYGLPSDMRRICEIARRRRVFVVDDAAQAMGARRQDRSSGTWGDAGMFSLDRGKNITAIDGGVLLSQSDVVARSIDRQLEMLPGPGRATLASACLKLGIYATFLRPSLYWIPNGIPALQLGRTTYTTDFPLERYNSLLSAMALQMLKRLDEFTEARRGNAARLAAGLSAVQGLQVPAVSTDAAPVYLRFPVLAAEGRIRANVLQTLMRHGIGASTSYPRSLADVDGLREFPGVAGADVPGARYVADRIITLPTHPLVCPADLDRILGLTSDACRQ